MTLSVRAEAEELMDADDLDAETYAAVVADLATVNTVTLAASADARFPETRDPRHETLQAARRRLRRR